MQPELVDVVPPLVPFDPPLAWLPPTSPVPPLAPLPASLPPVPALSEAAALPLPAVPAVSRVPPPQPKEMSVKAGTRSARSESIVQWVASPARVSERHARVDRRAACAVGETHRVTYIARAPARARSRSP